MSSLSPMLSRLLTVEPNLSVQFMQVTQSQQCRHPTALSCLLSALPTLTDRRKVHQQLMQPNKFHSTAKTSKESGSRTRLQSQRLLILRALSSWLAVAEA